ncbi:prolyl aminopeptidase [Candidatus Cyanaurora vandensis]|uniref:prolyl aminopeptidase n=1 Tax=Candidatus Cyanaurora vandensis TaxID=2714958 RepID=UPI00257AC85C|nr:prolyl aminopeptidase [Candidatus Cyanaurora vandensis]
MRTLYPPLAPHEQGLLPVSQLHTIYYEVSGNPSGQPVIFIHGGPGAGTEGTLRRFFNPEVYRIVLFDQRGSGKSTPHACLEENTTWDLVTDMEQLRVHLEIETWHVFGGSWGSTLALAYSETHPERVRSLVLRGIFLIRKAEIDWFYQEGTSNLFPDLWEDFVKVILPDQRHDLVTAYHRLLTGPDPEQCQQAARAWSTWEGATSKLQVDPATLNRFGQDRFALAFARIECHYFVNRGFFETDDQLLQNVNRIRHLPAVIVHGRYDVICPLKNAWDLHRVWPEAEFHIIPDAGHSAFEPGITDRLIRATDQMAGLA